MKTPTYLTIAAVALTVIALNASANDALLSPRATDLQTTIVPATSVDPNLVTESQSVPSRRVRGACWSMLPTRSRHATWRLAPVLWAVPSRSRERPRRPLLRAARSAPQPAPPPRPAAPAIERLFRRCEPGKLSGGGRKGPPPLVLMNKPDFNPDDAK